MPFSQKSIDFLVENRLHDSRDWFQQNKERFSADLLAPFVELVSTLAPDMLKIDDRLITEPKVDRTLSRIYRDTRFSKDKSLYRDNMWLVFMREKKLYDGLPAFYFDLNPEGFSYGMGYYQASRESMDAIRELVLGGGEAFARADDAYSRSIFRLYGDEYKRSKYPDEPENKRRWLDKKSLSFNTHSGDFELLFSDKLAGELLAGFRALAPVYEFLCLAESRKTR